MKKAAPKKAGAAPKRATAKKAAASKAAAPKSVDAYIAALPADRRDAIATLRKTLRANVPAGFEEAIAYGMITYSVPLSVYPDTYNKKPAMLAALGSHASTMSLYLMCAYADPKERAWLEKAWVVAGKKLDMGKSCVRFKKLDDVPLDVVGQAVSRVSVKQYVARLRAVHQK